MPEAVPSPTFIRFGVFELDLRSGELRKQGLRIRLQEKPSQILAILLEHAGEVITREELRQQLWPPDTFVDFDHSVNTAINKLREALGDSAENPRFIETLPRHGYRFIGHAESSQPAGTQAPVEGFQSAEPEPRLRLVRNRPPPEQTPVAAEPLSATLDTPRESKLPIYPRWAAIALAVFALIGAIAGELGYRYFRPLRKKPAPPMKVVPLTSFPGVERFPSFSPDGNQIAFAWDGEKQDNSDIYVKVIGTESVLRLTTNPAIDRAPVWSPDGRYIAFHRHTASEDGIYLIPALGGPERKLYSPSLPRLWGFERFDWSPDGKYLAFCENMPDDKLVRISALSVETLEKHVETTPPSSAAYGDLGPRYSPDGRMLAFQRYIAPSIRDVCVVPAAGGEPKRLTFNAGVDGLAWTPDGRNIIYSSDRGDTSGLWKIRVAGGEPERLSLGTADAYQLVLSRDGRRLAYVRASEDQNIWQFEVSSTPGLARPPTRLIASTAFDLAPEFSPDGKRIVFGSDRSGSWEIWVSDRDGSNPVRLTYFDGPMVGAPRWSPDGRQIVFDCDAGGYSNIYLVSTDGGQPRRLTKNGGNDVTPSWSRDGRWIYFASGRTGAWQVWKMSADGGKAAQVTKGGGFAAFESYDGKTLYYAKGQLASGLWKKPVGGGQETLILKQLMGGLWGYWGITRKGIYFYDSETGAIEFYSFATRNITRIVMPEKGPLVEYPGLSVSPDGRWILYAQADTLSSNIMLVENFRW